MRAARKLHSARTTESDQTVPHRNCPYCRDGCRKSSRICRLIDRGPITQPRTGGLSPFSSVFAAPSRMMSRHMLGKKTALKSRCHRTQTVADSRQPKRWARSLVIALTATAAASTAASTTATADYRSSIQHVGRLLGVGWGDGYHVCRDGGFRPGADLPPKGFPDQFGPPKKRVGFGGGGEIYPPGTGLARAHTAANSQSCDSGNCDYSPVGNSSYTSDVVDQTFSDRSVPQPLESKQIPPSTVTVKKSPINLSPIDPALSGQIGRAS